MTELEKHQALEIRDLQHKMKIREEFYKKECMNYEKELKDLKELIKYYKEVEKENIELKTKLRDVLKVI